jgi:hypothetical protein
MAEIGLSVVLAATDGYAVIAKTVERLRAQTVAQQMELVVVAPSVAHLNAPAGAFGGFGAWQVVEVGEIRSIGSANAAGVGAARAAVVALAEDHSFPEADWAERILAAHEGPWAVVGPAVRNANPGSAISWADFLIGYGPWAWPCESHEMEFLPGHNSSYKREALSGYGEELERYLEAETVLHWDLRRKGKRLYLDATVRTAHTNYSRWDVWLKVQYLGGRVFAGTRLAGAPGWKRAVFAMASPLIPVVRLARISRMAAGRGLWKQWVYCLPALVVGLTLDGVGQLAGYIGGPADAMARLAPYEFCRVRYINARDRREIFGEISV